MDQDRLERVAAVFSSLSAKTLIRFLELEIETEIVLDLLACDPESLTGEELEATLTAIETLPRPYDRVVAEAVLALEIEHAYREDALTCDRCDYVATDAYDLDDHKHGEWLPATFTEPGEWQCGGSHEDDIRF
jgi:hypothetical protein